MKQAWPKKRLGDLCLVNPREGKISLPPEGSKVSFVPMSAIDEKAGLIRLREVREYREVAKGYTSFRNNDVLFAKITPCMQNGKAAIARDLIGNIGFGSTEFHVLRPGSELLPEWIFAFLRQPLFKITAAANFTGTGGQQRVSASFMANSLIPVPPLPEQKRIVAILDAAAELRSLREKADQRASYLIPALFHEMFGDPATNPKRLPTRPLSEGMGSVILTKPSSAPDELFDYIDIGSIDNNQGKIASTKRIEGRNAPSRARQLVQAGDILVSTVRPNLKGTAKVQESFAGAIASTGFCVLRPMEFFLSEYIESLVRHPWFTNQLVLLCTGGSYPAVTDSVIKSIVVTAPPISVQRVFAAHVAEIRAMEVQQTESRRRLDDLFKSLLHSAFRGEL